jgi:DAK2 domain fusion protein YloV
VFPDRVDSGITSRWLLAARDALLHTRAEIDALNVFPVPDGDTGTNMYLTMEAAVRGLGDATSTELSDLINAAARGAFMGARGNSGVILSQMMRGMAQVLTEVEHPGPPAFAQALQRAADLGYEAVAEPLEGTILTAMRAAAEAAELAVQDGHRLPWVARAAIEAADEAVADSPNQLDVLAKAGVVDAGARGLAEVLGAMDTAMTGRRRQAPAPRHRRPTGSGTLPDTPGADLVEGGPAYEVMYLLESDEDRVAQLREQLGGLGDSLLVVGGEGLFNVHVHVDDVGAAVERGVEAGRPFRIRVTHFSDQVAEHRGERSSATAVVAMVLGEGLRELVARAGVVTVSSTVADTPSPEEFLEAIRSTNSTNVVLLPNHKDALGAAEAAVQEADAEGIRVSLIPTTKLVQGLAAIAVHDPDISFHRDVVAMANASAHVRNGAVTVAVKRALTTAGECTPGDILGIVEGDIVIIGEELAEVGELVLERMLAPGGELVTIISGLDAEPKLVKAVQEWVEERHPEVDVVVVDGGQARYPLLLGVE